MQENRFNLYMEEFDGLSAEELAVLVSACADAVEMQATYLPHRNPIIPLSTMCSAFAIYRKLKAISPKFTSILEYGPGCGYLSFFLKNHAALDRYSQVEAGESFYLLQNMVNTYCFGPRQKEWAQTPIIDNAYSYIPFTDPNFETPISAQMNEDRYRCYHFPWWQIGQISDDPFRYDIVSSNANLLEFDPAARTDYLSLASACIKPDGLFFMQCMGLEVNGTAKTLMSSMRDHGFKTLVFVPHETPVRSPRRKPASVNVLDTSLNRLSSAKFAVANAVFIKETHPLAKYCAPPRKDGSMTISDIELIDDMLFIRPEQRRHYTASDVAQLTQREIHKRGL